VPCRLAFRIIPEEHNVNIARPYLAIAPAISRAL
jgi:hypothetical protein